MRSVLYFLAALVAACVGGVGLSLLFGDAGLVPVLLWGALCGSVAALYD